MSSLRGIRRIVLSMSVSGCVVPAHHSFATTTRGEDRQMMRPRSEESGYTEDGPVPLPLLALRCAGCGYGARTRTEPERCRMCGGKAWAVEGWQPFAELERALQTGLQLHAAVMADASAPLTRDPHSPTRNLRASVVPSAPRTAE
jgi:hypothetical protein